MRLPSLSPFFHRHGTKTFLRKVRRRCQDSSRSVSFCVGSDELKFTITAKKPNTTSDSRSPCKSYCSTRWYVLTVPAPTRTARQAHQARHAANTQAAATAPPRLFPPNASGRPQASLERSSRFLRPLSCLRCAKMTLPCTLPRGRIVCHRCATLGSKCRPVGYRALLDIIS